MEKPTSIVLEEFKKKLANTINTSGLHPSIMEPILKSLWLDIANAATATYAQEKAQYEQTLAEEEENKPGPCPDTEPKVE